MKVLTEARARGDCRAVTELIRYSPAFAMLANG